MVGDAKRLHSVEVWLDDGVGRRSKNAELAAPSKRISHASAFPTTSMRRRLASRETARSRPHRLETGDYAGIDLLSGQILQEWN
jgi:hypothetical protein